MRRRRPLGALTPLRQRCLMAKLSDELNFVALDLEFNQPSQRIIQVGLSVGRRREPSSLYRRYQWIVNPGEPINPQIEQLTGIGDVDVADGMTLAEMSQAMLAVLALEGPYHLNPVVWGDGDTQALRMAFQAAGAPFPFGRRSVDVKTWHTYLCFAQGNSAQGGLGTVMRRYGLPFEGDAHRADVDALNTLRLFNALLDRQERLHGLAHSAAELLPR